METREILIMIDGDNVNFTYFNPIVNWVEQNGYTIKGVHLFGKLNSKYIQDWKAYFSVWPFVDQYPVCENHKNVTDIQMIAVAYKMYYEEDQRDYLIMSSDSDFSYMLSQFPNDSHFIVAYCPEKTSDSYISFLHEHGFETIDLDALRGPLTDKLRKDIVNTVLQAYLEFKLSPEYFKYDILLSWIHNRYGNIGLNSAKEVMPLCSDKQLVFSQDGVKVVDK